eukprot:XP_011668855.1 PREDICTED: uncharacterized protein LOC105440439 [Strongylocentrotus purpuratus]
MVISLKPKSGQIPRQRSEYFSRPFRDSSLRSFGQWITQADWSELDEFTGTDMKAARFQQILTAQYRSHFEQISIVRRPKDKEWMNNYIRRLIRTRDAHFRRGDVRAYNQARNLVQREIFRSKKDFYARKIQQLKQSEPGKWHQQIRNLTGMRKAPPLLKETGKLPAEIAHELNCHFARICNELPSLNLAALSAYLPGPRPPTIDREEVYKRLRRLNASKAGHPTDVPIRLLKEFAYELSLPLTIIFNKCLNNGHFPSSWKTASVCPVPKTSPVTEYNQIRPISITPIIARVFEGFLAEWVMADIKHQIDPKQFGNMKGSSVSHYLVSLLDDLPG